MKKIKFMDTSFRDGFQSCYGARVKTEDFQPALKAAAEAGTRYFEIGGGARFQSLYFYCQEDAFEMMDTCRETVGPDVNLQTLARGANVVGLISQSRDIIDLHAKLFKKHGITTIRNFDALNDVRNLAYSGSRIHAYGLKHQVVVSLMGLPPGLSNEYAHSPDFYFDCLQNIINEGIPFDTVCFKDASGTTTPKTVFETIQRAKKVLPGEVKIHMHTHSTAGMGVSCYMAAIEAGADIIDLSMRPLSGGTAQPDILTMWHRLKGTEYTIDIDYEKILKAEEIFEECMQEYFLPPEAKEVSPLIILSPMPGGALTANTQMMRDNNCFHLYPQVINEMREVVERGGFGTSVTPVSQFYFQQAFANVTQGKWKTITDGYGKMILGYFGRTPADPDPEIVKLAAEQMGLEPTKNDVHDINDNNPKLGIDTASEKLKQAGLPTNEENIFITATCGDKGIAFLQGDKPFGIRYKKDVETEQVISVKGKSEKQDTLKTAGQTGRYFVTVDGESYDVQVAPGGTTVTPAIPGSSKQAQAGRVIESSTKDNFEVKAPMPGTVMRIYVKAGEVVAAGQIIAMLEAMKMETKVKTERAGKVIEVLASQGDSLDSGDILVVMVEV